LSARRLQWFLLPAVLLLVSFWSAPRLFTYHVGALALDGGDARPVSLLRFNGLHLYYTAADLLYPNAFGKPGEFYDVLVFHVSSGDTGASSPIDAGNGEGQPIAASSIWVVQIAQALALKTGRGQPISGQTPTPRDREAVDAFLQFSRELDTLRTGEFRIHFLPEDATYRRSSGVRALVAIRTPDVTARPEAGPASGAVEAMVSALTDAARTHELRGVAVPFMPFSRTDSESGRRAYWEPVLRASMKAAPASLRRLVFGGRGVTLIRSDATAVDRGFEAALQAAGRSLRPERNALVHEMPRLSGIAALFFLARPSVRRRPFTLRRMAVFWLACCSVAVTASTSYEWLRPLVPLLQGAGVELAGKVGLAALAGACLPELLEVLTTKVRDELG